MDAGKCALSIIAAVMLLGGAAAAENAEPACTTAEPGLPCTGAESRLDGPERKIRVPSDSRYGWPRAGPGERWINDDAEPYSVDGRICWPHGDHFHCR